MNPKDLTAAEKEKLVDELLDSFDKALKVFMEMTMPPGTQFVMVLGGDNRSGAVISNLEDTELVIAFLTVALSKVRQ